MLHFLLKSPSSAANIGGRTEMAGGSQIRQPHTTASGPKSSLLAVQYTSSVVVSSLSTAFVYIRLDVQFHIEIRVHVKF